MARRERAVAHTSAGPLTVSALGQRFGLARSTLLYYDKLGLLKPTSLTAAGYRLYGPDAEARLARIVALRAAGMLFVGLDDAGPRGELPAHDEFAQLAIHEFRPCGPLRRSPLRRSHHAPSWPHDQRDAAGAVSCWRT